jgi:hypothetical protein
LIVDPELRADQDAIAAARLRNNFLKIPVPRPGTVSLSGRYSPGKSFTGKRVADAGRRCAGGVFFANLGARKSKDSIMTTTRPEGCSVFLVED